MYVDKAKTMTPNTISLSGPTSHQNAKITSHFTPCRSHKMSCLLTGGPARQKQRQREKKHLDSGFMTTYITYSHLCPVYNHV